MQAFPLPQVYQLLEPGPVVLLTTFGGDRPNAMTLSWHTMLDFEPPKLACVIDQENFSFAALQASGECVIAIPSAELAETVVAIGNSSGEDIDKFQSFGLTPLPASLVKAPMVGECFANLECRVIDRCLVNKYNLFILEVLQAWTDPSQPEPKTLHHKGFGRFVVDGETLDLISNMR